VSETIGKDFKTRVPVFGDDASIQEAFYVYHFGVDNYTSQPIPNDSIEGHFRALNQRVSDSESAIAGLGSTFVEQVSLSTAPNIITPQTSGVVPLTVRGVFNQVAELQRWQSNTGTNLVVFHPAGSASFQSYLNIGAVTQSTTVGVNISLANAAHRGVVVRGAASQSANFQEWQNSAGTIVARVDNIGRIYSENIEVVNLSRTQTLTNKTLTSPTITGPTISSATISNATISNATITGASITNAVSITLSGAQALTSRVRNIIVSTGNPTGGSDGDIWVRYLN
jgi:hypothetical protein